LISVGSRIRRAINVKHENVKHISQMSKYENVMSDAARLLIGVGGHIRPVIKCQM